MKKPLIASDIDGVIIDWVTPFIGHINNHFGYTLTYDQCITFVIEDLLQISGTDVLRMMHHFNQSVQIHDLPFIPEGYQGMKQLQEEFEVVFITSRPVSYEQKTREIIESHFGASVVFAHGAKLQYDTEMTRKKKWQIADELGALYLIEDNPHEFDGWEASTKPICHKQPWNASLPTVHPDIPHVTWEEIPSVIRGI